MTTQPLNVKLHYNAFHVSLNKKTVLMKLNMIHCILLVLLLLVSMVPLKSTNSPLVVYFLIFAQLFHLQVLLIIILPVCFVIFSHLQFLMITLAKMLFLLFLKLKMQTFPKKFLLSYDVTSLFTNILLQESIDIAINLIFNPNINRKELPFHYITESCYF